MNLSQSLALSIGKHPTDLTFDPASMHVSPAGLDSYYWPVRQEEIMAASSAIIGALKATLSDPLRRGDDNARYAYAVSAPLFMEFLGIFAARLLASRCRADEVSPKLPEGAALWRAAFLGEPFPDPRPLRLLRAGVRKGPAWRRALRPLSNLVPKRDFFSRGSISSTNFERDVVIVTPCKLSKKHAAETGVRPVYAPLSEWFYPPTADELEAEPLRPVLPEFRDKLVNALENVFLQRGAEPAKIRPDALPKIIDEATAWARFYLERVERNRRQIPKKLWKGSSGVVWSRFLADAVQANGGEVTGHDHAYGANYSEDTLIPFTELQANDTFVTYTHAHVDLYERRRAELQIGPKPPRIKSVGGSTKSVEPTAAVGGEPKSVLYVPNYLSNGRVVAMPFLPPVVAFDWQARLFTILRDMGLQVTQKPHPDTAVPPLAAFTNFGVTTRHERFEQVMNDYDVLLFDYPTQTCFGWALRSDKPMVLIDFGVVTYKPELLALLEKRCAIVPGHFDNENRAQVPPEVLRDAILKAGMLRDRGFADAVIAL